MYLFDITKTGLSGLLSNKLRTSLATLGIIIGVAAVIAMMAVARGAAANVTSNIQSLGTDLLFIRPGSVRHGVLRTGEAQTLTIQDAEAIKRLVPGVVAVSPEVAGSVQVKYFSKNKNTTAMGTGSRFPLIRNFLVEEGRFFDDKDVRLIRKVVVLGSEVKKELFGDQPAIGRTVRIKSIPFEVVGLLEEKGDRGWFNPDDQIIVPLSTAQKRIFGIDHLRNISVKVSPSYDMDKVVGQISRLLRERHKIPFDKESDFRIRSQLELLESLSDITSTLTFLLAGIAGISLLVGGIGIMNIMLVTVTERTREIGVRKAVGATRNDILLQFLVESASIAAFGGAIGIILGYAIALGISYFGGWEAQILADSIIIAAIYSIATGIIFGVYPAIKAANMRPVEALRYE